MTSPKMKSWLVVVVLVVQTTSFELPNTGGGCQITRTHGMMAADCGGGKIKHIPTNLNTRIQVLDVSGNDIRELTKDSLSRYSSLRFLYLGGNHISLVDDAAFEPLTSLEVLDLSVSSLYRIPFGVLQLPVLRKLDFSENLPSLVPPDPYKDAPVSNSLKALSLAENRLREFPPLWMVPQLEYLNVSGNKLEAIRITDIAPMCRLKEIDATRNPQLFKSGVDNCECYLFTSWIEERNIKLYPPVTYNCPPVPSDKCENSTALQEAVKLHSKCNSSVEMFQRQAAIKKTWLWAGVAAGSLLLLVLLVGIFLHCKNSNRRKVRANNNNQMMTNDVKKVPPDPSSSQLLQEL